MSQCASVGELRPFPNRNEAFVLISTLLFQSSLTYSRTRQTLSQISHSRPFTRYLEYTRGQLPLSPNVGTTLCIIFLPTGNNLSYWVTEMPQKIPLHVWFVLY